MGDSLISLLSFRDSSESLSSVITLPESSTENSWVDLLNYFDRKGISKTASCFPTYVDDLKLKKRFNFSCEIGFCTCSQCLPFHKSEIQKWSKAHHRFKVGFGPSVYRQSEAPNCGRQLPQNKNSNVNAK